MKDTELKDYVFQFKDYLLSERKLAKNTVKSYYQDVLQFYEFLSLMEKYSKLEEYFSIDNLDEYLIYLGNKQLENRSILRKISSISTFLKFLKIEGVIKKNNSYLIDRPKTRQKLPEYLTLDEVERFIDSFELKKPEGIRDRTLFELMYSCGLRVSEISALNIDDFYQKERILRVFGKGNKERYVPVGERAVREILYYFKESRPLLEKKYKNNFAFFLNFRGDRLSRKGIWRNLKINAGLSGIKKDFTVHSLRHSFATHLIQNGADIRSVQVLLGHKSINTTEIYTHLNIEHIKETYDKFHT